MDIIKNSISGTLESSDAQVLIEPNDIGRDIKLESSVFLQYGQHILTVINDVLDSLDVKDVKMLVKDQGALDCTIKARVETAIV